MKDDIGKCIEQIEEAILALEQGASHDNLQNVMGKLGLTHLKLPAASVIALMDMLTEGITPITPEIVTSFLSITDAQKRFLYSLAGLLDPSARQATAKSAAAAVAEVSEAVPAPGPESEPEGGPAPDEGAKATARPASKTARPKEDADAKPAQLKAQESISSIRVDTAKLDSLIDLVGKLMVSFAVISQDTSIKASTMAGLRELETVIDKIKGEVDHIRLVPLKQIFLPMRRLVSTLTQKIDKKVNFEIIGEDLALDKQIVEYINEPLVHLLRNAVDHGLETPDEREASGKDKTGNVRLVAERKGETAYIRVIDDGRGLDAERIKAKAMERGLWDEAKEYTEGEIFQFIMQSGFSTAKEVTDVSGRGVGMDAVLNAVSQQLDGEIDIKSKVGQGSTFTLVIPLSRSVDQGINDALVCRIGEEQIIIPSRDVLEIYQTGENELTKLPDGTETVSVRGELYGVIRLGDVLSIESVPESEPPKAVLVKVGDHGAAILVDEVLRQQQVVITNFTVPVQEIYALPILGYGMMGDSDAMVVNVEKLIHQIKGIEEAA